MTRVIVDDSGEGKLPEGWHPAIFLGEKEIETGAAVGVFSIMQQEGSKLIDTGRKIDVYFSPKDNPKGYKKSIIEQLFAALGVAKPANPGMSIDFPKFGEPMPGALSVPVMIHTTYNEKGYLKSWADNYLYIKEFVMAPSAPASNNSGWGN